MRSKVFLTVLVFSLLLSIGVVQAQDPVTINVLYMAQAALSTEEMDAIIAEFEALNPNINVEVEYVAYEALHDKFTTSMATDPVPYDVVMVDVIWYTEFVQRGYILDVTDRITQDMRDNIFDAAWNVVNVGGRDYGMPWLLDTKYFYYNQDILSQAGIDAPATTWEGVIEQAQAIKDAGLLEYPLVFDWAQAEAVICDFTALVYGNGGQFLDEEGNPAFNGPEGVAALQWMVDSINNGLTNPASITYLEEDVRNVFSSGQAAFTLNWLYMYNLANFNEEESQVTGNVGITTIPVFQSVADQGIPSASVDGSSGFSVVANSDNPDEAWAFIEYLTSEPTQMTYSQNMLPVWESAFEGENLDILSAIGPASPVTVPMFAEQFPYAHVRPTVPYYLEGSVQLQLAIQLALTGQMTPQEALDQAEAVWTELGAQMQ